MTTGLCASKAPPDGSEFMVLPDFLIIGAQKSGTSWLHQRLRGHSQIFLPHDKDDEFFSYLPQKPLADYAARFHAAHKCQLIGDTCASYFWTAPGDFAPAGFNPEIPRTIRSALGAGLKLIVLVKDPVQRTLSGYLHHIAHRTLDCNVSIMDAPAKLGLLALSCYGRHLANWLQYFPPEQMQALPAVGSVAGCQLLAAVCRFLAIESQPEHPAIEQSVFPGLQRLTLDDGIWVALGQPGIETVDRLASSTPLMERNGKHYARLVQAYELERIREILKPDTAHFAEQVCLHGWDHQAFHAWSTWPA